MKENKMNYSDEWRRTLTGKLTCFWIFATLTLLAAIGLFIYSLYTVLETQTPMIWLIVLTTLNFVLIILDMVIVSQQMSKAMHVLFGIVAILIIGSAICGIFMILIADYIDDDDQLEPLPEYLKQKIKKDDKLTEWYYYKQAKVLELTFGNKITLVYNVNKRIFKAWQKMSKAEQTKYYFDNWYKEK